MSAALVSVKVVRALFVRGERYAPGDTIALAPLDALTACEGGRAELVDLKDVAVLKRASAETTKAVLSRPFRDEANRPRGRWV